MSKYDASGLLFHPAEDDRFLDQITVSANDIRIMKAARVLVRNKIKRAFTIAKADVDFMHRLSPDQRLAFQGIEPRFWPQGSFLYGTQNFPAHTPPQQVDLDDGAYLPIENMRDAPIINKEIFFSIVDNALCALADEHGWGFRKKDTCARLEISPLIHLDVPLYAIPKERFIELQKAAGRVAINTQDESFSVSRRLLKEDEIYLARRDNIHWVKSDPMAIADWFQSSVDTHGPILQRVCRYLKAWRDHNWEKGGPSSIALMICACSVFDSKASGFANDSNALAAILNELPKLLSGNVVNPLDIDDVIFPRKISKSEQEKIVDTARLVTLDVSEVLDRGTSPNSVVEVFHRHWGPRMPSISSWVVHIGTATSAIASVRALSAKPTPAPKVPNMKAG